ncbi:MAG: amino acid adenylation domain-containing protein, partial [Gemmatimonadetes bacterium]|nr:amino acid adenylation domain-containing protein [Gemmatimonadota bacterium]
MNRKNVEDLYPLSPLQQGMLFHTLYSPGSGAYLEQMTMRLAGTVDADAFRRAWQTVVDRHPILRTGFVWDGVPQPLQVVFRQVELPFIDGDWRALAVDEQARRFSAELDAERAAGFDLARAPLVRVRLFRTGEREYRFALTIHHMLIDGWSLPILLGEFAALYDGFLHGTHPPLPNRRPFRDYVGWLRQQDAGAAEAYWRARLGGFTAPTPLPLDRAPARAGAPAESYAQARVVLAPALVAALEGAARQMRATPSGVLQCAWAVVLAAYAGTRDVVFGATVSGRPPELPGVEEMVGMFINTVPVRIHVPRGGTVAEWVQAAHQEQGEARLYEHAPLAEVRGWSGVPAERPLFETLLVYENYPLDALRNAEAFDAAQTEPDDDGFEVVEAHSPERTNYPLSLVSAPEAGAFRIGATYDPGRLDDASVRALLDGLVRVVTQIAEDPSRPVTELTPVAPGDAERLTRGMATPALAGDRGDTVQALFARAAAATPDGIAVAHEGRRMTYAELDARANRLAWRLRALGVGPEVSVGVCLRRTPELVVALLAVLKAGGAYVPLDPAYPADRLGFMLRDAGAPVVIAEHATEAALPWTDARVLAVDLEADEIAAESPVAPEDLAAAENLAWTLYTSGSTGRPKGVQIEHRAAVAFLRWMRGWVAEDELPGVLFSTSVSFDVSVAELWFTLCAGGTLVMAENALYLAELGPEAGVRRASMVPSAAAELVRGGRVPETVRTIGLGGEALAPAVAEAIYSLPHVRRVENLYGPTEDTTYSLAWLVPRGAGRVLVGRPIAGSAAYVLDDLLRTAPAGAHGEMYLAGDGLARGYRGRPAQTAERFLPDPFGAPGARMYRSGDLGRWVDDALEYLGRADFQVKVRGFRIEPGEIEALLLAHPAVTEAAVVARPAAGGDSRLVAYVAGDAVPAAAELKAHLSASLPDYMVPGAFVALPALPRTPNGKVDRAALPDAEASASAEFVAPEGLAEEALAEIWKEVLRRDRIGANDSFFELGGHSLLATQVVSRVRAAFGVELQLRTIFENTTLRALAAAVEDLLIADIESSGTSGPATDAAAGDAAVPPAVVTTDAAQSGLDAAAPPPAEPPAEVVPVARGGLLAASLRQERLWFLDRLNPGSAPAHAVAVELPGTVDGDSLARAVAEVVRRHEILRTTFAEVAGRPLQRIHPFAGFALEMEDAGDALAATDRGDEPADAVAAAVSAEAARPFDLAAGPLFRARLIRGGVPVLVLAAHATVADDASLQSLALEIAFRYHAFRRGEASPLPEPAVQYADFAAWQRTAVASEGVERHVEAWRARLAGAPTVLDLPADHPRPAARTFAAAAAEVALDAGTVRRVRDLASRERMVPDAVLLAVWELLLSRLSGSDDLLLGFENPGPWPLTEKYGGPLANVLVLRAGIRAGDPFRAHLARVRDELTAAQVHGAPFERLLDEIPIERSLSRAPLVQAAFAYRRVPGSVEIEDVRTLAVTVAPAVTEPDLSLEILEMGDAVRVRLVYAAELFDAATAARWGDAFAALLASALDDPSRAVGDLAWMDDAARDAVLALAAGEASELPASPIHRLFEAHAAARPDAPALVGDGVRITYAQANARANRIARRLRELGVRAEDRVGVAMARSPDLVIALLAVLKAGAAYVPLDPVYPRERLAAMRRDAGVSVVIADAADGDEGLLSLMDERGRIDALPDGDLAEIDVSPEALAYVIYTSGSTGTPKGVAVSHRAVIRLVRGQAYARFAADEVFLQFAPVAFDPSTFEIWGALLNGAALAIHPPATPGPAELGAFVARHGVTQLWLTAGFFHQVVDAGAPGLRGARRLLAGGDVLSPTHVRRVMELLPETEIVDGYGPTEATTFATTHPVTRADAEAGDIPIGRPIANTRAYVLDARLRPVPAGVPGDLYLGGPGLARGYLGVPALTAERFVPDPFGTGERLYRTGDRARWIGARGGASESPGTALPHSRTPALQFLGRADRQLKVRGFRIEPGEVEAALLTHPAVREAVAGAVGSGGAKRLVAWIVPAAGETVNAAAVRAHLSATLPEHAVPSAFVAVPSIPLTPNGKVDRAALSLPGDEAAARPLTPTEEAIAAD